MKREIKQRLERIALQGVHDQGVVDRALAGLAISNPAGERLAHRILDELELVADDVSEMEEQIALLSISRQEMRGWTFGRVRRLLAEREGGVEGD